MRVAELLGVDHVVAEDTVEEERGVEVAPPSREVEAGGEVGVGITDHRLVVLVDHAAGVVAVVDVAVLELARQCILAHQARVEALLQRLYDAVVHVAVEDVDRLPDSQYVGVGAVLLPQVADHLILHAGAGVGDQSRLDAATQVEHLVAVHREDERAVEAPLLAVGQHRVDGRLEAAVLYLAVVHPHAVVAAREGEVALPQQVGGHLVVEVEGGTQPSPQHGHVDTEVGLGGGLPLQVGVGDAAPHLPDAVLAGVAGDVTGSDGGDPLPFVVVLGGAIAAQRLVGADALVARDAVAEAELKLAEELLLLHEGLLVCFPADGSRGEVGPFLVLAELGGAVGTEGEGGQVTVVERVVDASQSREQLALREAVGEDVVGLLAGTHVLIAQRLVHEAVGDQL